MDDLQYRILEQEAEKREARKELERLMTEFLLGGGKIIRIGPPKPNKEPIKGHFKYKNRKQRGSVE